MFLSSAFFIASVIISGSPFEMIHKMDVGNILPPMWLWGFLSLIWGFLVGYSAGVIFFYAIRKRSDKESELRAYKGGMFFLASAFFFVLHYPLFFVGGRMLIALIAALVAMACACACAFFWSRVAAFATIIMSAYAFWLFYVVFITLSIIFQN